MHQVCLLELLKMVVSNLFLQPKLTMIFHLPQTMSFLPIFAVDFCVVGHRQLAAQFPDLRNVCNMHQVRLLVLLHMVTSDFLLQPKPTMIFHLQQTLSLLPTFAVDFCVPGHHQLAARFPDLRNV